MSGIVLGELTTQLGLEGVDVSRQKVAADFMPAAICGLSDGDLGVLHEPYTGEDARLYGERFYNNGEVAMKIAKAAIKCGLEPSALYAFQGFAADYYDLPGSPFYRSINPSSLRVHPEIVTIDGNSLVLPRSPQLVMDFGACLNSRGIIRDQVGFLQEGRQPFAYLPLTRMHFTNLVLMRTYDRLLPQGSGGAFVETGLYIGREDGIANATDEMLDSQRAHDAPTDIMDIIYCNGNQHTTKGELRRGISNAHSLLAESGMLIIRSLARPSGEEAGSDEIAGWAFDAGFQERHSLYYESMSHNIGEAALKGKPTLRAIKTVVVTKQ